MDKSKKKGWKLHCKHERQKDARESTRYLNKLNGEKYETTDEVKDDIVSDDVHEAELKRQWIDQRRKDGDSTSNIRDKSYRQRSESYINKMNGEKYEGIGLSTDRLRDEIESGGVEIEESELDKQVNEARSSYTTQSWKGLDEWGSEHGSGTATGGKITKIPVEGESSPQYINVKHWHRVPIQQGAYNTNANVSTTQTNIPTGAPFNQVPTQVPITGDVDNGSPVNVNYSHNPKPQTQVPITGDVDNGSPVNVNYSHNPKPQTQVPITGDVDNGSPVKCKLFSQP